MNRDNLIWLLSGVGLTLGIKKIYNWSMDPQNQFQIKRQLNKILPDETDADRIAAIFGQKTTEAKLAYQQVRNSIISELTKIQGGIKAIDQHKYQQALQQVLTQFQNSQQIPQDQLKRIEKYLKQDYQLVKNYLQSNQASLV